MSVFTSLAVVMVVAAIGGVLAKLFKQPALVGYILAGIVLAYMGFGGLGQQKTTIELLGQMGVTLLLFLVGMELPISQLVSSARSSFIVGIGQILITTGLGYILARGLGFGSVTACYVGISLTFGSTVIVVQQLSAKRDLHSLYGRITVGYLLLQDFVAIGILTILSGLSPLGGINWVNMVWVVVKGLVMVGVAGVLAEKIVPKVLTKLAGSSEMLFVVAIAWCLGVAGLVSSRAIGFGVELGGFLAGLTLANAAQSLQIVARTRPLRDFFLMWFFVALGANIGLIGTMGLWWQALLLSAFVVVVSPVVVMVILSLLGYHRRVAFLASLAVAQVSEFSLIILTLAVKAGHIDAWVLSLVGIVAVVTMTISTYLITYAENIYKIVGRFIPIGRSRNRLGDQSGKKEWVDHVVLFGHNRTGSALKPVLEKLEMPLLVVDFDPQVVEKLGEVGLYGDVADYDLYEEINLDRAALVISTVSDANDSLQLVDFLHKKKHRPMVIVTAVDNDEAKRLYAAGADYVLIPHAVGGEYLAHLISTHGLDRDFIADRGKTHQLKMQDG